LRKQHSIQSLSKTYKYLHNYGPRCFFYYDNPSSGESSVYEYDSDEEFICAKNPTIEEVVEELNFLNNYQIIDNNNNTF